ncbi:MAG: hypothetical protein UZ19_OD1000808 [Parcubacteria bacterium OLB19]|nr:MAG: hypothetical protein UZ19_OD1000808 [Parcubacteria bacterium OLB19]
MFEKPSDISKYPEALSIDYMSEGGYRFLHRVFRTYFKTDSPVIINTGGLYFKYQYEKGHRTFAEGIVLLEGDKEVKQGTYNRFMNVVNSFNLDMAFDENGIERPI